MVRPFISCLMSAMLVSGAAVAQDRDDARFSPDRPSPWAFEFGAGTDNRSKGASKNGDAPYVFGEVQWITASGFYADAEFETIDTRLRFEHSPDGLGSTRATTSVEARLRWALADRLDGSVTVRQRAQDNAPDHTGGNAGITRNFTDAAAIDFRWHGTSAAAEGEQFEDDVVASILVEF